MQKMQKGGVSTMKKRLVALLVCLCLLFTLTPPALAADDVFFVAVNDTIPLTLTGVAPYYSSGGLYVPYTVFDAAPGGIASAYNASDQTFVLFTRAYRLIFDLAAQSVTDETNTTSDVTVSYRNGVLYVPLNLCASHFGLATSMLTSLGGYTVLRFTTGSEVYEDSLFIEKAENLIAYRISQLQTPDEPTVPDTPPEKNDDPPQPQEEDPPDLPPAVCYLAVMQSDGMQAAADVLSQQNLHAAFFLTEHEIEEAPDLVRALFVAGHTLGVRAAPDAQDVGASLDAANDALYRVLQRKTVLALTESGEPAAGYRVLSAASDRPPEPGQTRLSVVSSDAASQIAAFLEQGVTISLLRETIDLAE